MAFDPEIKETKEGPILSIYYGGYLPRMIVPLLTRQNAEDLKSKLDEYLKEYDS